MPKDTHTTAARTTRAGKRTSAARADGHKSDHPKTSPAKPATRKPRTGKAAPPPADPEAAAAAVAAVKQALQELEAARDRREELVAAVAEAELRIADLHRQAGELGDLGELRKDVGTLRAQIEVSARQAAEMSRSVAETAGALGAILEQSATAREGVEAVRRAAGNLGHLAQEARDRGDEFKAEAAKAREELDAVGLRWQELRNEFGVVEADTRGVMEELRRAVEETRERLNPPEPEPQPEGSEAGDEHAGGVEVPEPADLPDVEAVPAEELAPDARERLVRYLNDAASVEREQAGLLQTLADATEDPTLRAEFERHRAAGEELRGAVEGRVRALGGEPSGGKGVLGHLVARLWDVLEKPRSAPDAVEALLKALGAAEMEAGMYRAVHALARLLGESETAALAATRHRQERDFADWVRERVTRTSARAARRPAGT
jgi:ferritin-like metal-binding protein YciE